MTLTKIQYNKLKKGIIKKEMPLEIINQVPETPVSPTEVNPNIYQPTTSESFSSQTEHQADRDRMFMSKETLLLYNALQEITIKLNVLQDILTEIRKINEKKITVSYG